jgi:hypothetical protein
MGLSGPKKFELHDFSKVFDVRNADGKPYILIGGQAVNYWAERYLEIEPELKEFVPFTSQDIDFKGNRDDVKLIATQLGQKAIFPGMVMTALAGSIPLFLDEKTSIEVVRLVPGVSEVQLETTAADVEFHGKRLRVIDPISLSASKLDLSMTVDQDGRQDVRHLKILVICVRAFLREMLALVDGGGLAAGWLGAINQMRKIATSTKGRGAKKRLAVDWSQFLPRAQIEAAKNEKIVRFREMQLATWKF